MNKYPVINKVIAVLALAGLVKAVYLLWARPYRLRWGATDEEVQRPMPGDELISNPKYLATRAITIEARPEEIWPWLIQMGYKRAGFYGYDIIENLGSPRGIRSAQTIVPEFQHFKVGDELPISPAGGLTFYAIEPNRYLIWSGDVSWGGYTYTWALYPIDENHTRLVSRARFNYTWSKPGQLALDLFTEVAEHLAIPKILKGVKGRVEGHIEPMAQANMEVAIYFASASTFLGAVILILLRPLTWRRWLIGLAAGVAWLITWFAPRPIWKGASGFLASGQRIPQALLAKSCLMPAPADSSSAAAHLTPPNQKEAVSVSRGSDYRIQGLKGQQQGEAQGTVPEGRP